MKARSLAFKLLATGCLILGLSSCIVSHFVPLSSDIFHNVVIQKEGINLPGTALSQTDHEEMLRILSQYPSSLYRIDTYNDNAPTRTAGHLENVLTDSFLASEIAGNVTKKGFTRDARRIGYVSNNQMGGGAKIVNCVGKTCKSMALTGGSNHQMNDPNMVENRDLEELVRKLSPILEKYTKKG